MRNQGWRFDRIHDHNGDARQELQEEQQQVEEVQLHLRHKWNPDISWTVTDRLLVLLARAIYSAYNAKLSLFYVLLKTQVLPVYAYKNLYIL